MTILNEWPYLFIMYYAYSASFLRFFFIAFPPNKRPAPIIPATDEAASPVFGSLPYERELTGVSERDSEESSLVELDTDSDKVPLVDCEIDSDGRVLPDSLMDALRLVEVEIDSLNDALELIEAEAE